MKFNKKKVFALSLAVCLIAILSFSTLAWFSDDDSVTNKFQLADSTQNPDNIFSIDVLEKIDGNGDGDYEDEEDSVVDEGDVPDGGYTYEEILPGSKLSKEPIVVNTGAYDQFVRVKVTVDNADTWTALLAGYGITDLTTIFDGYSEDIWTRYDEPTVSADGKKITYVYYLDRVLTPDEQETLFTHVTIPTQFTQQDMAHFVGGMFTMDIVAQAVQAENIADNAYDAFAIVDRDQPFA